MVIYNHGGKKMKLNKNGIETICIILDTICNVITLIVLLLG